MRKEHRLLIRNYELSLKHRLFTTRFNDHTHAELTNYLQRKNKSCIYSSPIKIPDRIPYDKILFVLEMNNSQNKIMGIGMVKNHPFIKKYCIFSNQNYNRFNYVGSYRITRENMSERENEVIGALEYFCFKGSRHLKRQQGLTKFPTVLLYKWLNIINIMDFISNMFKHRLENKNSS
jgi:hypothetical protein